MNGSVSLASDHFVPMNLVYMAYPGSRIFMTEGPNKRMLAAVGVKKAVTITFVDIEVGEQKMKPGKRRR